MGVVVSAGDLAAHSSFLVDAVFLHRKDCTCSRMNRGLRRTQIHRIKCIHYRECCSSWSNGLAKHSLIILTCDNSFIIKLGMNRQDLKWYRSASGFLFGCGKGIRMILFRRMWGCMDALILLWCEEWDVVINESIYRLNSSVEIASKMH